MDFMETRALVKAMFKPTSYLLMAYILCLNCGRIRLRKYSAPSAALHYLELIISKKLMTRFTSKTLKEKTLPFLLPINPYFGFHPAFYRVTGTDETGAALSLSIKAENEGLRLRILDVEGRVKEDYSNYV